MTFSFDKGISHPHSLEHFALHSVGHQFNSAFHLRQSIARALLSIISFARCLTSPLNHTIQDDDEPFQTTKEGRSLFYDHRTNDD